jgi:alpha-glucosidase
MIRGASSSGWMADFGEYLPFDAQLHNGENGANYHNLYPQEWAKINEEAILEARQEGITQRVKYRSSKINSDSDNEVSDSRNASSTDESEVVYFMRSGWLESPGHASLFWLGDQMVSWDKYDGIQTVVVGALSGGLGGHSLTHSDIGGYTMVRMSITYFNNS